MTSLFNKLAVVLLLAALLAYVPIANAEQYLCVAEETSGFTYDTRTKSWDSASLPTDAKYLLSESKDPRYAYHLTELGNNYELVSCKKDFNPYGFIFCSGPRLSVLDYDFRLSRRDGRFLLSFPVGYYALARGLGRQLAEETSPNPYMQIGNARRSSGLPLASMFLWITICTGA
jgi:hypothetical protein